MGLLGTIGKGIMSFFGGGGAKVVDEYIHTSQERTETDQQDLASARAMQAPSHNSPFDILVDAFSRLIRPGVTLWIVGGFSGWWTLPTPDKIDPFWEQVFWIVLTFWFGGRALMKDIPKFIGAVRALRK